MEGTAGGAVGDAVGGAVRGAVGGAMEGMMEGVAQSLSPRPTGDVAPGFSPRPPSHASLLAASPAHAPPLALASLPAGGCLVVRGARDILHDDGSVLQRNAAQAGWGEVEPTLTLEG